MSATAILIPILQQVGAPILKSIIQRSLPGKGADLAGEVIDTIAGRIGSDATPEAISAAHSADPDAVEAAIRRVEIENGAALLALQEQAINQQFALLQAETKAGGWKDGWRWGWMYLLGLFWIWQLFAIATGTPTLQTSELATLTGYFMALYMGGHTLKQLGQSAVSAVRRKPD